MSRYLDPKADVVFKKVFHDHPHLLKSILNAILPLPPDGWIDSIEYLPSEQAPAIPALKRPIADVRCKDIRGRVFIVEMQIEWTDSFKQRLLFESSQAYVKQLQKGERYHMLQPVYGVGLINDIFEKGTTNWYHHYQLVNVQHPERAVIDGLQLLFIELPKFEQYRQQDHRMRELWLRFMSEIDENTRIVPPELLAEPDIREAIELAQEAAYSLAELDAYRAYWDSVSSEKTLLIGRYEEGMQEGEARGIAIGEERGIAIGEERGIEQTLKALDLLKQGIDIHTIAKITGLSVNIIQKLR